MAEYLNSLPDGWTIYLWMVAGALIILAAVIAIRWAQKNEQFDEDIKYLVFDEEDRDKMDPEEFAKAQAVLKQQIQRRKEVLAEQQKERAARHAKR